MFLKKLCIAAFALFSAGAIACPNLAGTYNCHYDDGDEVTKISQVTKAGVTTCVVGREKIIADNVVRRLPNSDDLRNATLQSWCENDQLKAELKGMAYDGKTLVGAVTVMNTVYLDTNGLVMQSDETLVRGGESEWFEFAIQCDRVR